MTSGIRREGAEFQLQPSPALAALGLFLTVGSMLAVFFSGLNPAVSILLAIGGFGVGVRTAWLLLFPDLGLRIETEALFWRRRGKLWSSQVRSRFVSPWFIGWRTGSFGACGVFRGQLGEQAFRRLAVVLRHAGTDEAR